MGFQVTLLGKLIAASLVRAGKFTVEKIIEWSVTARTRDIFEMIDLQDAEVSSLIVTLRVAFTSECFHALWAVQ